MSGFVDQLSRTKTFRGQITAETLSQSLTELEMLDKTSERKKSKGCLIAASGVIGLVCAFFLANAPSGIVWLGWLIGAAGLGACVWGSVMRAAASSTDFEDKRYQLLSRMHSLMKVDMAADASLDLLLDMQPVDSKNKKVNSGRAGIWNVDYYEDPWLKLTVKLLDGSRLSLTFIEKYQYRHRKKRSASGKIKHKSKTKSSVQAVATLKSKEEKYPMPAELVRQAKGAVQLPSGSTVKGFSVEDGVLVLKVASKTTWTVNSASQLLSAMMLSLYQVLNLSRRVRKAGQQ